MQLSATLGAICLFLAAAQAQEDRVQCAVQGSSGYDIGLTDSYTATSCSWSQGWQTRSNSGTISRGLACCQLAVSSVDTFYARCRLFNGGTPQPC